MLAMQYSITLSDDYDMDVIRRRIHDKGPLLDGFDGLHFKSYLYARRGEDGPESLYAPFYVWRRPEGMNRFLLGPGFAGLAADFGRPAVAVWSMLHLAGGHDLRQARWATSSVDTVAPGADLKAMWREEQAVAERAARDGGALAAVAAYDPRRWERIRFVLWRDEQRGPRFRVGYVATAT